MQRPLRRCAQGDVAADSPASWAWIVVSCASQKIRTVRRPTGIGPKPAGAIVRSGNPDGAIRRGCRKLRTHSSQRGASSFCSRSRQNGVVTPQPVIGQVRTAPPAIDRVVAAEIFLMRDDIPAE